MEVQLSTREIYNQVVRFIDKNKETLEYRDGSTEYKIKGGGCVIVYNNMKLFFVGLDDKIKKNLLKLIGTN